MTSTSKDPCEWNPLDHEAASDTHGVPSYGSCENPAELIVGANGAWRLCRRCWGQDRAYFWRYRVIREIKQETRTLDGIVAQGGD